MLKNLQKLLFPLAIIYAGVLHIRHFLYDIGIFKSKKYELPIIGVGNLSFGGAGKSPFVIYLAELALLRNKKVAIISRGYGRKTKGLIHCTAQHTSEQIGDEPKMYISKLQDVQVIVSEKRSLAIDALINYKNPPDVILLDDCYQHRQVSPSVLFLLTTESTPYWLDALVPAGYLRDIKSGAKRADALVVTKSSQESKIQTPSYWDEKNVFFSSIQYEKVCVQNSTELTHGKVIGFSGLADNSLMKNRLEKNFELLKFFSYNDHHFYTPNELSEMVKYSEQNGNIPIITTEKDYSRLNDSQKEDLGEKLLVLKISTPVSKEEELIQFLTDRKVL